jgi:hypothetical protein
MRSGGRRGSNDRGNLHALQLLTWQKTHSPKRRQHIANPDTGHWASDTTSHLGAIVVSSRQTYENTKQEQSFAHGLGCMHRCIQESTCPCWYYFIGVYKKMYTETCAVERLQGDSGRNTSARPLVTRCPARTRRVGPTHLVPWVGTGLASTSA